MSFPFTPSDIFETASRGSVEGVSVPPTASGLGSRQSRIPNERKGVSTRKMMRWLVPEQPIVEMYINPQSVQYSYEKLVTETRTKGGFTLQYWGENITNLNIQGTTGTSSIEGINVLYDIYRNEQLMYDPYALVLQSQQNRTEDDSFDSLLGIGGISDLNNILNPISPVIRNKPTLASMAFTVELYWSGEVYRGYFKNFTVSESAQQLGLFDYTITFRATQRRGYRNNFLGWHKSATNGPSNSGVGGPPHSFNGLMVSGATAPRSNIDQPVAGKFVDPYGQAGKVIKDIVETVIDPFDIF